MYRYYVKISFKRITESYNFMVTKPLELEYKTKKQLIKEVLELFDSTVKCVYILDRANELGSNFGEDNLDRLKNGYF